MEKRLYIRLAWAVSLLMLFPYILWAQSGESDTIRLNVKVVDSFTREALHDATVSVMETDSATLLCERMGNGGASQMNRATREYFQAVVPYRKAYVVKVVMENYDTLYSRIQVPHRKFGVKFKEWFSDPLVLRRSNRSYDIGTAVVRASRVAMVVKGDTIEYDARAFQLAEGSMLDNLLSMMPGMHITASGQIYVNGQFVDKLLVNGRDFFNGNPRVALDNLPAYTVDKVKVYHQALKWEHLIDEDNPSDERKPLVVDVRLRREYAESWLANFEAAGGSSLHGGWRGRYLGRLFAMRHTDHSSIGIYANVNNLGDKQSPGRKGEWKKMDPDAGETRVAMAGAHFSVDWKQTGTALTSSVEVRREDILTQMRRTTVGRAGILQLYDSGESEADNGQTDVKWEGQVSFKTKNAFFEFQPSLAYSHAVRTATAFSSQEQQRDSEGEDEFWTEVYSRNYNDWLRSNVWHPGLVFNSRIKSPFSGKNYGVTFKFDYTHATRTQTRQERVYYPAQADASSLDWFDDAPRRNYNYQLTLTRDLFRLKKKKLSLNANVWYFFTQSYTRDARTRLNHEDNDLTGGALLPSSTADDNWSIDRSNTFLTGEFGRSHMLRTQFRGSYKTMTLTLRFDIRHQTRRLQDFRNGTPQHIRRTDFNWWMPTVTLAVGRNLTFNYASFVQQVPMVQLLAVRDASDWQHIFLGNPDLKNSVLHTAFVRYNRTWTKHARWFNTNLQGNFIHNAIGQQCTYDYETGVRTTTPRNVGGNRSLNLTVGYGQALDKTGRLLFSSSAWGSVRRSVDFSRSGLEGGEDGTQNLRSVVRNYNTGAEVGLNYRTQKGMHLGAKGRVEHTRQAARPLAYYRNAFTDYSYGLTLTMPITARLSLETDAMAYARNGYADESMNATDFVWNAALSYTPDKKKQWLIRAVGFDILHQLESVRRTVNDQGYTETWYNTVPSYATLHIIYRLNIQPKKRGQ